MPEGLAQRLDRGLDHVALREQATGLVRPAVGYDLAVPLRRATGCRRTRRRRRTTWSWWSRRSVLTSWPRWWCAANRQIASALALSEWTVQDHAKALLAKLDVQSRGELAAALFFGHYVPLHVST